MQEISEYMEKYDQDVESWLGNHATSIKENHERLQNFERFIADELMSSGDDEEELESSKSENTEVKQDGLNGETNKHMFDNSRIEKEKNTFIQKCRECFKGSPQLMQEYLESKLQLLKAFREKKFSGYYKKKDAEVQKTRHEAIDEKQTALENILRDNTPSYISKNSRIIEKKLMNLFHLVEESSENSSDWEDFPLKKIKISSQSQTTAKITAGYKIADFLTMSKYRVDPLKLPVFSAQYDEARKDMLKKGGEGFLFTPNKAKNSFLKGANQKGLIKTRKPGEVANDDALNKATKIVKPEYPVFVDDMKKELLSEKDKEKAKQKAKSMNKAELEKYEKAMLKKHWQAVNRGVIRIFRLRQDLDTNTRKFAYFCSKEVKKKIMRNQRNSREFVFRAKRMHREMLIYWRRREKELTELKKKKEKLEMEIKRREEEEREKLLQRRRLEYLMKQSGLYSHFMAKKLGMEQELVEEKAQQEGEAGANEIQTKKITEPAPRGPPIEIDENQALNEVKNLINQRREELREFDLETQKQRVEAGGEEGQISQLDLISKEDLMMANQTLDFSNADIGNPVKIVETPKSFQGELKEYQIKGLRWLDNLYEQGINGILADEMGLGKTIQAIALLAHLSEKKNNWGPFLVVAPSSTLFNWQQEIKRFCPQLRVLPYWGGLKERKTIRKYFNQKTLGTVNSPFHVVVTSYQLIVADEKSFQRLKWQYMILDEAQAIKNINSQRWKILLSFNSRNRLLLTGTPIQNTMAELWALLHFIMPKLFDSHDQFQEWFSKDIEANSQDQKTINQHQLSKLHAILKPFMLRRIKKDVEHEIGQKKEHQMLCQMTKRQQLLYDSIKQNLSLRDFFQMFESKAKMENLMNLVMQFRKVCNHPELFERRQCRTPFSFHNHYHYTGNLPVGLGQLKDITVSYKNPIQYILPKLVYDELLEGIDPRNVLNSKEALIRKHFSIFSSDNIHQSLFPSKTGKKIVHNFNTFSFIRFLNIDEKILELHMSTDQIYSVLVLLHLLKTLNATHSCWTAWKDKHIFEVSNTKYARRNMFWINRQILNIWNHDETINGTLNRTYTAVREFIPYHIYVMKAYLPRAISTYYDVRCSSNHFTKTFSSSLKAALGHKLVFGSSFGTAYSLLTGVERLPHLGLSSFVGYKNNIGQAPVLQKGIFEYALDESSMFIEIPSFESLIADSCKLQYLNELLPRLKKNGERVLIFCQMTKMLDLLEEYLARKQYQYFRLDGSSNIADRRDMVAEFQNNPKIFAFILSTRAGGLGITLTAADAVIFYDNDWNPTMDAQATDRAHRIGRTKDVNVYRLIVKSTIEERIVKRAQQKQNVQTAVYSGGAFKADSLKRQEVMELLFDENEIDMSQTNKFMVKSNAPKKKGQKKEKKETKAPPPRSRRRGARNADAASSTKDGMDIEAGEDEDKKDDEMDMDFSNLIDKDDD